MAINGRRFICSQCGRRGKACTCPLPPEAKEAPAPVTAEKPRRTIRVIEWDGTAGLILITEAGESDVYAIRRMNTGPIQFSKIRNTDRLGFLVSPPRTVTGHNRCDCPGFVTHKKCRHCAAVVFLVTTNRL